LVHEIATPVVAEKASQLSQLFGMLSPILALAVRSYWQCNERKQREARGIKLAGRSKYQDLLSQNQVVRASCMADLSCFLFS
jgi:hypothetical protein